MAPNLGLRARSQRYPRFPQPPLCFLQQRPRHSPTTSISDLLDEACKVVVHSG